MLRPATPLSVLLFVAFGLLLISVLSTPIIQAIPLGSFNNFNFGVFGYCDGSTCSKIEIGYDTCRLSRHVSAPPRAATVLSDAAQRMEHWMLTYPLSFSYRWRRERLRPADFDEIDSLYYSDCSPRGRPGHPDQPDPRVGVSPSFPLTFFQISPCSISHQHHRSPPVPPGIPRRCVALRPAHGLRVVLCACRYHPCRIGHACLMRHAQDHREPQGKEEANR